MPGVGLEASEGRRHTLPSKTPGCSASARPSSPLFPSPVFQAVSLSPHVSSKETRLRPAGVANEFQAPEESLARPAPHPTPGPGRQVAPPDGRGLKLSGKEEAFRVGLEVSGDQLNSEALGGRIPSKVLAAKVP